MTEPDDLFLLREFAASASESAFAALVERHVNLVYSTARRSVGNAHAAQEISQAVFIILARKAGKLSSRVVLSGWLYQTARLTAANYLRGEIRRQQRESEAYMQSTLNEPDETVWPQIAPLLDDALAKLGERDRNAIVLRFFENQSLAGVGTALGASEDAAKMRVNRALEKLRKIFTKRGVTLPAALIAGAVSANSVQAAPVGLTTTISVTAVKGAAVTATVTTLVKGTLKLMTYAKLKLALGITAGILLTASAATVAISQTSGNDNWTPQEIIMQSQDAYAALSSYSDSGTVVSQVGDNVITNAFNMRLQRPNFYRINWPERTASFSNGGTVWSDGNGDFMAQYFRRRQFKPVKYHDMQSALSASAGGSLGASASIPCAFFNQNWGNVLKINLAKSSLVKLKDELVGGVNCFVLSSIVDTVNPPDEGNPEDFGLGKDEKRTTTLWIGKRDHLVHQSKTVEERFVFPLPEVSDATIKGMVERQNKQATPENMAAIRTQLEARNAQFQNTVASGKLISTQAHDHIVVNQKFSPADFAR